ncbi:MAG: PRC-barrel domain-containing protein [Hyphomicrobiaceae bacterium]
MKKTFLAASIFALAASAPALAQQPTAPASPSAPAEKIERPAEPGSMNRTDPAMKPATPSATKPAGDKAAMKDTSDKQAAVHGEWRASKLIGSTIVNAANESIGEINDLIISNDGKVASVIVGVGGFLGMGEKNVALAYHELSVSKDANGKTVVTSKATKEALDSMPEWKAGSRL